MASSTGQLPSFLPPDPKVEEPYLLTPRMAMRVAILGGIALIAFGVLFLRLWSLQILSPDKYRTAAAENQLRRDSIEAPRGTIVDRQGRVIVRNVSSTAVVVWPASLPTRLGPRHRGARAREDPRHPVLEAPPADPGAPGRPADAGHAQGRGLRRRSWTTSTSTRASSRASTSSRRTCARIRPRSSSRKVSATSARSPPSS